MASVFLSQVVETGARCAERQLRPDLGNDEASPISAQQIAVAKHRAGVQLEDRRDQRRIDQVTLAGLGEALQPIRAPCRKRVHDEQVREQPLVCHGSLRLTPANWMSVASAAMPAVLSAYASRRPRRAGSRP